MVFGTLLIMVQHGKKIPGTTECTEIVSASETSAIPYAWLATSAGLKKWKVGDAGLTGATVTTGACTALKISPDGNVIVLCIWF